MGQMNIPNSELVMTQYKNTDIALQKFQNQYEHKWQQQKLYSNEGKGMHICSEMNNIFIIQ